VLVGGMSLYYEPSWSTGMELDYSCHVAIVACVRSTT
jgi:hypothetical protein